MPCSRPGKRRRPERPDVDVGARQDLHVREGLGGRGVDAGDAGVREQRADERDRERPLERQVLHVATLAAEEARVLLPQHAISEDAHGRRAYRSCPERTIDRARERSVDDSYGHAGADPSDEPEHRRVVEPNAAV